MRSLFKFDCDAGFLDHFRNGNREALDKVYRAYAREVEVNVRRVLASRHLHAKNMDAAVEPRDVMQEVFVRAFSERARRAFDGTRPYGPYLGALSRNLAVDATRRQRPEIPQDAFDIATGPCQELEVENQHDPSEVLTKYLNKAPAILRAVHEQRHVHERTQSEACLALGLTRQQLRTLEARFRNGLATRLANCCPER